MKTYHKIVTGDSRNMREVRDESVHLVVTSPPYWQLKDYGTVIWQKVATTNTTGGASVMGSFPYPRNGILKIDTSFSIRFGSIKKLTSKNFSSAPK